MLYTLVFILQVLIAENLTAVEIEYTQCIQWVLTMNILSSIHNSFFIQAKNINIKT